MIARSRARAAALRIVGSCGSSASAADGASAAHAAAMQMDILNFIGSAPLIPLFAYLLSAFARSIDLRRAAGASPIMDNRRAA
jgi:hypothetical protein